MARLAIYGTGGFGREIVPMVRRRLTEQPGAWTEIVFVDDNDPAARIFGLPVLRPDQLVAGDGYAIAISDGRVRQRLDQQCRNAGLVPVTIAADSYYEGEDVVAGDGGIFCHQTMVTASARIGRQFHCNHFSYVSHDCQIGDYVTFAPRVYCSGNVHIGDLAYVGAGAILKQGRPDKPLTIGAGAVIGMGAIVTKDVAAGETVVGNPARPLR